MSKSPLLCANVKNNFAYKPGPFYKMKMATYMLNLLGSKNAIGGQSQGKVYTEGLENKIIVPGKRPNDI